MASVDDEASLLKHWDEESLGNYEGKWIAWTDGKVAMSAPRLSALTEEFRGSMQGGNGPLFAFVSFIPRV